MMIAVKIISAFFACLGFGIVLNAPRKELICCGICGLLSFAVYVILGEVIDSTLAVFIATVVSMAFARNCSYRRKAPSTIYVIMGILPHVPGGGMYSTMYALLNSDVITAALRGIDTLRIAGVIAIAVILVFLLPPKLFTIGVKKEI